jgi:hypothetical protein
VECVGLVKSKQQPKLKRQPPAKKLR